MTAMTATSGWQGRAGLTREVLERTGEDGAEIKMIKEVVRVAVQYCRKPSLSGDSKALPAAYLDGSRAMNRRRGCWLWLWLRLWLSDKSGRSR